MSGPSFRRVGWLSKGYDTSQVDAYLGAVESAFAAPGAAVSAARIRKAGFDLVRRGYAVGEVDAYLDVMEERAMRSERATEEAPGRAAAGSVSGLEHVIKAPQGARLERVGRLTRGYHPGEVDAFLDKLALPADAGTPVTVDEVRHVVFHARRGGYSEDAVDDLLDRVVDQLLRQDA